MKRGLIIVCVALLIVVCASFSLTNPFIGEWSYGTGKTKVEYLFGTGGMVRIVGPKVAGTADYEWDSNSLTLKYRSDSRILYYHYAFSKDHSQLTLQDLSLKNPIILTKGK
jgi:hypothetical protein